MPTQPDPVTGEIKFDPSKYLRKLSGRDYLEVKWRLLWLRTEYPGASIQTDIHTLHDNFALFKAFVRIPDRGEATGWGSETKADFGDFIEKAETKALGRALAALGFGTQFCDDHNFDPEERGKVVDSPVERSNGDPSLATPAQLKLVYLTATKDLGLSEEEFEKAVAAHYGRLPAQLTKAEASKLIEWLKAGGKGQMPGDPVAAPSPSKGKPAKETANGKGEVPPKGQTGLVSEDALKEIWKAAQQLGYKPEDVEKGTRDLYGKSPRYLSKAEAAEYLDHLKMKIDSSSNAEQATQAKYPF